MNRKEFLKSTLAVAAMAATLSPMNVFASGKEAPKPDKKDKDQILKLSFGEGTAPGKTLEERLDFMDKHHIVGLEPNGGNLGKRINEFNQLLSGRDIKIGAICAGFQGFILAEDAAVRKQFDDTIREIIAAAGVLKSVGVVMVPAFNGQKPCMPHTADTRKFLVEQLAKLGEYARSQGTTIILEPLNRGEAHYLRQVADAASLCRDTKEAGVKCMGDFWHMTSEEASDYGALHSAGKEYLQHIHIASRARRCMPGEDGEVDNYINGFKALKEVGYDKFVSFECGSKGDKAVTVPAAIELLRAQWKKA
ncbi:MAG: sugar phosphate isomerase/epimerase family protein [Rikenellaceae bacterium]